MNDYSNLTFQSIQRYLFWGVALIVFITFGIGGWAASTEISGALVASGVLVVDSNVKKVQHQTGGMVGELRVREGDHVAAGEIVIRLDETQARAAATIVSRTLDDLKARQARLEAERDNADFVVFPVNQPQGTVTAKSEKGKAENSGSAKIGLRLSVSVSESESLDSIGAEKRLFELRRGAREGQKSQLRERVAQFKEEIQGYRGQVTAKEREIEFINQELIGVRELWSKSLVPMNRVTALQRDAARLEGERSQLLGATAQAKGKITETELQIIQIDQDLRTEVGKELVEIQSKISELVQRKVAAEDQLKHIDIRAPQSGRVHQLAIHTIGGVIAPGEPIMLIVPDAETLTTEVKVSPVDIDQVYLGQRAALKFSAFNQRTTPEIFGEVTLLSADLTQDQRTGASYYSVRISPLPTELPRLGEVKLIPGMPVEAFIKTTERTVLSYLLKPIRDQASKAFTER